MNKTDIENNLNRVHEWIRAADTKVGILLALEGIVITLLLSDAFTNSAKSLHFNCWTTIFIIASIVLLFVSAYKAILAIIPRLKRGKKKGSLLYFGNVADMELKAYEKAMKEMNESEYIEELLEQTHISSKIAASKHRHFRDSIIAVSLSFVLMAIVWLTQLSPIWLTKMS